MSLARACDAGSMELSEQYEWRGRRVRWGRMGSGPDVVFCHGTPWSSRLWMPFATALSERFTVYLWDMPGYGQSSKSADHRVSLDLQGELLGDLISYWGITRPHVVAHDYGGAVSLRAHLLHGTDYSSLALVDVVALAPWGSDFFRLVGANLETFCALPDAIHEGALRAYISGASHVGLSERQLDALVSDWLGEEGKAAFYRQMGEADQAYTDEMEGLYPLLKMPVLVVWGDDDAWIPVDRAHRLAAVIPDAKLCVINQAGHLIQLDQPAQLAVALTDWLITQAGRQQ